VPAEVTTKLLTGTDPRDGRAVGAGVPEAGPDEAAEAARQAARAMRERVPAGTPGAFDDAALLEAIAAGLAEVTADLVAVAERETALPTDRLAGEVGRTVGQLRAFAAASRDGLLADAIIDTARPATADTPARPDQRRVARPLGPVAVFSASNFPFAFSTAGGDTASALAVGCPVILKAHPDHPATSYVTGEVVDAAVRACGAPPGWFQVLHGGSVELALALATAPEVAAVAFTGSLRAGRALYDAAARREVPIPVFAEMGSLNPVVVTPGALAARAAEIGRLLGGAVVGSAGQLCTKPNLVLTVDGPGLDDLVGALAAVLRGTPELVMLTPRLRNGFDEAWRHLAGSAGVDVVVPAAPLPRPGAWEAPGLATVAASTLLDRPDLVEERFGPGTVVAVARDGAELGRLAERLPGSLTGTLHAEVGEVGTPEVVRLADVLAASSGRLVWNGVPTGVTVGYATVHGGPYPATTAPSTTSVGLTAARRFQRPVGYQSWPDPMLPAELRDANPLGIIRLVDGAFTREPIGP
jgi:acyl-CoA reductase-like NAD-dependent aldehyde dehydrogenase